ncbi:hypothetical protein WAJ05_22300, partial [Acinetobacter baumannii]
GNRHEKHGSKELFAYGRHPESDLSNDYTYLTTRYHPDAYLCHLTPCHSPDTEPASDKLCQNCKNCYYNCQNYYV